MFFIPQYDKPHNRQATYLRIVAEDKPHKKEKKRIRFTVGGDRIEYKGKPPSKSILIVSYLPQGLNTVQLILVTFIWELH